MTSDRNRGTVLCHMSEDIHRKIVTFLTATFAQTEGRRCVRLELLDRDRDSAVVADSAGPLRAHLNAWNMPEDPALFAEPGKIDELTTAIIARSQDHADSFGSGWHRFEIRAVRHLGTRFAHSFCLAAGGETKRVSSKQSDLDSSTKPFSLDMSSKLNIRPQGMVSVSSRPLDVAFCPMRFQIAGRPEDWIIWGISIDGVQQPMKPREGAWVMPGKQLLMKAIYVGSNPDGEPFTCVVSGVMEAADQRRFAEDQKRQQDEQRRRADDDARRKAEDDRRRGAQDAKHAEDERRRADEDARNPMGLNSPMDAVYDGFSLRELLARDEIRRREVSMRARPTPAQQAAVSDHWSALLRAKVADAARADRNRVRVDLDDVDE